jgi:GNAT superfamily N-acetyltransferase
MTSRTSTGRSLAPSTPDALAVDLLDATVGDDHDVVDWLTDLVNAVYATAESGLWRSDVTRTTTREMAALIRAHEIAVARLDGRSVGSVRVHAISDTMGEFGMLVVAPENRDAGVGRALVDFAERVCREGGLDAIQLEVLVPRGWQHPSKELLRAWYGRIGYRFVRTGRIDDDYPHLAPQLATACDFEIYEKPLRD